MEAETGDTDVKGSLTARERKKSFQSRPLVLVAQGPHSHVLGRQGVCPPLLSPPLVGSDLG